MAGQAISPRPPPPPSSATATWTETCGKAPTGSCALRRGDDSAGGV